MSTQSSKVEVIWSPNKDEDFATYGAELKLYSLQELEIDGPSLTGTELSLSSSHYGRHISSLNADVHCMPQPHCVAWQNSSIRPYFFAVGQSSGKVLLSNLGFDQPMLPSTNQVLSPRYGRPCTCLAWNPVESHLLAEGLDKARNDTSLVVWDVTRASVESTPVPDKSRLPAAFRPQSDPASSADDSAKYFESGGGEATSSLAWLPSQPFCLMAGMGTRYLKLFDIRERSGTQVMPREVANHKALYGLCVDPISMQRVATFAEGSTVYIWDIRHFARPSYSFSRSGTISRLAWVPTKSGCLSVVLSESPYLHLIDIPVVLDSTDVQVDSAELYIEHLTQKVHDRCPYYMAAKDENVPRLTGVSWHSKWKNFCLYGNSEGEVKALKAHDRMPVSWSANEELVYGSLNDMYCGAQKEVSLESEDISLKMRQRVKLGYGFDPQTNSKLVKDDKSLCEVWEWLLLLKQLTATGVLPVDKSRRSLPGITGVLGVERNTDGEYPNSSSKRISWQDRSGTVQGEFPQFPTYKSSERQTAFKICGWSFGDEEQTLEDYLKREEMNERFERAAAIAVFQGKLRRAIASLKDGAGVAKQQGHADKSSLLNLIALALSGYTPQESRLWHETCSVVKAQITDAYLRAVFNFLCSTGRNDFKAVLGELGMTLQDRVAFSCIYLDDIQLHNYISHLTKKVIENGQINGLFLTGLTPDGTRLLTNYVDKTGDVQTACLIAGQVAPSDKMVKAWFQGYRDLLDVWQLWHERALFDSQRKKLDATFKPPRQAFVMCNFCSKSIASDSIRLDRRSAFHSSQLGRKATSCPSCRKPLPRCSICLLNMAATSRQPGQPRETTGLTYQFEQWFTWCQSCRHGGHAQHMVDWFSNHQECPVTGCTCRCFSLDTVL